MGEVAGNGFPWYLLEATRGCKECEVRETPSKLIVR